MEKNTPTKFIFHIILTALCLFFVFPAEVTPQETEVTIEAFIVVDINKALNDLKNPDAVIFDKAIADLNSLPFQDRARTLPALFQSSREEPYGRRRNANIILGNFRTSLISSMRGNYNHDYVKSLVEILEETGLLSQANDPQVADYVESLLLPSRTKTSNIDYETFDAVFPLIVEKIKDPLKTELVRGFFARVIDSVEVLSAEQQNTLAELLLNIDKKEKHIRARLIAALVKNKYKSEEIYSELWNMFQNSKFEVDIWDLGYCQHAIAIIEGMNEPDYLKSGELLAALDYFDEKYNKAKQDYLERSANSSSVKQQALSYLDEETNQREAVRLRFIVYIRASLVRLLVQSTKEKDELLPRLFKILDEEALVVKTFGHDGEINFRLDLAGRETPNILAMFKYIGKSAVPALSDKYGSDHSNKNDIIFLSALYFIGEEAVDDKTGDRILDQVLGILNNGEQYSDTKDLAVRTLGSIGSARPGVVVHTLIEKHNSRRLGLDVSASIALKDIAKNLMRKGDTNYNALLREAEKVLLTNDKDQVQENARDIQDSLKSLDSAWWEKKVWRPLYYTLPYLLPVAFYLLLLTACLIVLWLKPILIFRINQKLLHFPLEQKVPMLGYFTAPFRYFLLVGFFYYSRRVLDAWIQKYQGNINTGFLNRGVVAERQTHIPIPVKVNDKRLAELSPEDLKPFFKTSATFIMISGDGGVGKTSHACSIAKWGMGADEDKRLCRHILLPIMIEQGNRLLNAGASNIVENIARMQIERYTEQSSPLSPELLRKLIERKRLLIIIDGFSEMPREIRDQILRNLSDLSATAVILTSRNYENIEDFFPQNIRPMKIEGNFLSSFLDSYLTVRNVRDEFDTEFFDMCEHLSRMTPDRGITPLFVKLFADLSIASKIDDRPREKEEEEFPQNIPDLIYYYINYLNRSSDKEIRDEEVHLAARITAWHCLKKTYSPSLAAREDVFQELGGDEKATAQLAYLEEKLRLISIVGVERDEIRFSLEPLAEYLASFQLIKILGDKERDWERFFADLARQGENIQEQKGFVYSLQECCATKYQASVPDFVPDELKKISGAELKYPRTITRTRINQIIHDVELVDERTLKIIKEKIALMSENNDQ
ncbi:MAG TPA: hypothetical protein VGO50_08160 [Pyrinomonadaceae bacterium]|jgi:hypothetical protein|nr:hypothetical protein [Pyrinomonadaceae bacterium]